ncbi:5-(carboxyamino)imidazole ribonucleotide mutase [Oceanivirga miroungae]|uniref:N5-carboxyaminoimidazole ribonucleotide mutase n=1 Tax=Oceanivirga miroungae TaxID=1130046 RepID=A0A6I8MDJ6_9FUSO|nr:5-(carboxyamino)imidazole ribonucleotide mutase [Oceanivirga miroungae]VWL85523.1 phosphoribosylaminoimidazole carboxylase catalytic subunit [Oceanivirga miroungae]
MKVAIIFGSLSDKEIMSNAAKCLKEFNIEYKAFVLSAHRVPELLKETIENLEKEDFSIIIAGAGMAAHLPGVIASLTTIPVIGVPINASLQGMDALLAIVQMPKSIPVATVGINNSYNAGLLAVQILAISNKDLKEKLSKFRIDMKENFKKNINVEL